ncbi:MAG: ferredoxin [Spirochaetota bacterium]
MASISVDTDLCIGCGLCVEICPKVFELRERKDWIIKPGVLELRPKEAIVIDPNPDESCDFQLAVATCPVAAILFEQK